MDFYNEKLTPEGGVTDASLKNAEALIEQHGVPIELYFKADKQHCYYVVEAKWADGAVFVFTGFSWGYGGTGPAGLLRFLDMAKVSELIPDDLPIDKYGKTSVTWRRANGLQ